MILAPVDAEVSRGSAQVQISTRSGTNEFHGALDWNALNSTLDANTWNNNRNNVELANWRNIHEISGSIGGPIVRNRTHFFALYNQKWTRTREIFNSPVLTPCARNGIYRYYDDWSNANVNASINSGGTNPSRPVVDANGSPLAPDGPPDDVAGPYDNTLRYISVFGPVVNTPSAPDCSDAIVDTGAPWDTVRTSLDPTGYITDTYLDYMPAPNNFETGDGLNTAGHRWARSLNGADNLFGIGEPTDRRQFNIRVDHIFTQNHKVNASYSYERTDASDAPPRWPGTWGSTVWKEPQVMTFNFTSTLSPRMVNEARIGMVRTGTNSPEPSLHPDNDDLRAILPTAFDGMTTVMPRPGTGDVFYGGGPAGSRGTFQHQVTLESSPRYQFGDTLSVTSGAHSFKIGGEYRYAASNFRQSGAFGAPGTSEHIVAQGGATQFSPVNGFQNVPNMVTNNEDTAEDLLVFLSGSLTSIGQYRYINDPNDAGVRWNDPQTDPLRERTFKQNEFGIFVKDDWKVADNLTLNLGARWDYYGPPWEESGNAATLRGFGAGLFGISGNGFDDWWTGSDSGNLSEFLFVGKNSLNPDIHTYPRDTNNFGPAIGFAWNADERTIVRGGYQLQYFGGGGFSAVDGNLGNPPGTAVTALYTGDSVNTYLDLTDITVGGAPVPVIPFDSEGNELLPLAPSPVTSRSGTINVYDENYVNPYVQNLTLSITRNLARNFTMDFRYIGTLTRKNYTSFDVNQPNFLQNGLFEAFESARMGDESALLDQMLMGVRINGLSGAPAGVVGGGDGVINPGELTGAESLRRSTSFRSNLANGNYDGIADTLANLNYSTALNPDLPGFAGGINGTVLRVASYADGTPIPGKTATPENFILTNPQFGTANLVTNGARSNYHSFQVQGTLRPTYGLNLTSTYTWSKNLGVNGNTYRDPRNRNLDYTLTGGHRSHSLRVYGTFRLPFGPNQALGGNTSGILARAIEGWEASWIFNAASGSPQTIGASSMLFGTGTADLVREFDFSEIRGVVWEDGAPQGTYFSGEFSQVADPQCATIATSIQQFCNLDAIVDSSGEIILQTPLPGTLGNTGLGILEGPGIWSLDMAMTKSFQINERFRGSLRFDASNVLNHPTPDTTPCLSIAGCGGGQQFGEVATRGSNTGQLPGWRQFQARLRLEF
jgi:hypothetical protein